MQSRRKLRAGLRRELYELLGPRPLISAAFVAGLQALTVLLVARPVLGENLGNLLMLGGLAAMAATFDRLSVEREHHTLDLLLAAGLSRLQMVSIKVLSVVLFCCLLAAEAILVTGLGLSVKGHVPTLAAVIAALLATCALLSYYGLLGLALSVVLRRTKPTLVVALLAWGILRPTFFAPLLMQGLARLANLSREASLRALNALPEVAYHLIVTGRRLDGMDASPGLAAALLAGYVGALAAVSVVVFLHQDEPAR